MGEGPSTPEGRPQHLVVMGVTGSGKSTVAKRLATRLGYEFAEGDDFHPPANVEKMSSGVPLDDEDRLPWLRALAAWVGERDRHGRSTIMTCSALRRSYRDILREGAANTFFVHLVGERALLLRRMEGRKHFMPTSLLDSQLDALEPLEEDEQGITADITQSSGKIEASVVQELGLG